MTPLIISALVVLLVYCAGKKYIRWIEETEEDDTDLNNREL